MGCLHYMAPHDPHYNLGKPPWYSLCSLQPCTYSGVADVCPSLVKDSVGVQISVQLTEIFYKLMQKQCIEDYCIPRRHPKAPDVKTAEEMIKGKGFMCLSSTSLSLGTHLRPLLEAGCDTHHWCCPAHPFSCSKFVCHGIRISKIKVQKWAEPQVIRCLWQ